MQKKKIVYRKFPTIFVLFHLTENWAKFPERICYQPYIIYMYKEEVYRMRKLRTNIQIIGNMLKIWIWSSPLYGLYVCNVHVQIQTNPNTTRSLCQCYIRLTDEKKKNWGCENRINFSCSWGKMMFFPWFVANLWVCWDKNYFYCRFIVKSPNDGVIFHNQFIMLDGMCFGFFFVLLLKICKLFFKCFFFVIFMWFTRVQRDTAGRS